MVITQIGLENFKAFGARQSARLGRLTLIYGPNSGGKSTLIQSLLLLKQSARLSPKGFSGIVPRGPFVDLGSFANIVHQHAKGVKPSIEIGFGTKAQFQFTLGPVGAQAVSGRVEQMSVDLPELGTCSLDIEDTRARFDRVDLSPEAKRGLDSAKAHFSNSESRRVFAAFVGRAGKQSNLLDRALDTFVNYSESLRVSGWLPDTVATMFSALEPLIPGTADISDARTKQALRDFDDMEREISRRWSRMPEGLLEELDRLIHLGPMRAKPARLRQVAGAVERFDQSGEFLFEDLASNRGQNSDYGVKELNKWCKTFEIPYRFTAGWAGDDAIGHSAWLKVTDVRTNTEMALPDVGYGISQLLPILLAGLQQSNGIVCVEQPELHLHPRQQGHLADFLLWRKTEEFQVVGEQDTESVDLSNQWIVETHSEAIVSRIQRRVREGKVSPSDISVLFVEPSVEGSRLIELRLDDRGEFVDAWPGGFFEETYWDLFGGVH